MRRGSLTDDAVRAVWTGPRTRRIELQSLALAEINELLCTVLGGRIDRPSRGALWKLCSGNVLLLRELVLAGLTGGGLTWADGVWHWQPAGPVTPSVRELVSHRIAALTPAAREMLEVIAIGDPLPAVLVTGGPHEQGRPAIRNSIR